MGDDMDPTAQADQDQAERQARLKTLAQDAGYYRDQLIAAGWTRGEAIELVIAEQEREPE